MSEPFFPNLHESVLLQLRVVLQQVATNPGYLSHEKCPYPPKAIEFLQELTQAEAVVDTETPTFDGEGDRLEYVEGEVVKVLTELNALSASLRDAGYSEKLQILKTRSTLVEKLLTYREKIWSMKEMAEFQARIIGFLETSCSKDQVQELKEALRGLQSVESAS